MNKNAIVIGANGGIGGGLARALVKRGYHVYTPVRDITKDTVQPLLNNSQITVETCNPGSTDEMDSWIQTVSNDVVFEVIVLAAGTFKWDDDKMFKGDVAAAIKYLDDANYVTKEVPLNSINKFMGDQQKHMTLIGISSHAASHPEWKDENERGYVTAMEKVSALLRKQEGRFKRVILEETEQVDTPMFRGAFSASGNLDKAMNPDIYAEQVLAKAGL